MLFLKNNKHFETDISDFRQKLSLIQMMLGRKTLTSPDPQVDVCTKAVARGSPVPDIALESNPMDRGEWGALTVTLGQRCHNERRGALGPLI